jgi:hypothetical protein
MPATVCPVRWWKWSVLMAVMIGIDPHKGSHTAVAVTAAEELLGKVRVRARGFALGLGKMVLTSGVGEVVNIARLNIRTICLVHEAKRRTPAGDRHRRPAAAQIRKPERRNHQPP